MIELSRHIECLLVKHNCVIIPNFGGFVTQYMSARLIKEESLYLPPYRSISFNSELQHNDGLLVQSYMQVYGTDYAETLQMISNAVQQMKTELQERGNVEMSGIGKILLDANGRYDFEPYESGIVAPELYGLDSFAVSLRSQEELKAESQKKEARAKTKKRPQRILRKNKRAYMLSINRELVNYAAAAIVAVAFFFAWTAPMSNLSSETNTQAGFFSMSKSKAELSKANNRPKAEVKKASQAAAPLTTEVKNVEETAQYTIVLMSHITQKSADATIAAYHAEGISEVYQMDTKVRRVAYGKYKSLEEAEAAVKQARRDTKIPDAWVMKIK